MGEATLWIWGGTALVPGQPKGILEDAAIGIADGKITYVGTRQKAAPSAGARKIDATGCLVLPGLVNGHTHTGMSLLRGIADDQPLEIWLREHIFPLERKWTSPEFTYWGSLLASAEMIRSGTTSFNDMYFFQDQSARAVNEAGLRMVAGQTIVEESDVDKAGNDPIRTFERFLEAVADYPLVTPRIAPHAIYSVSSATWKKIIAFCEKKNLGVHTHLSEVQSEVAECLKKFGKSPVEIFEDMGLWDLPALAAHAVCLSEKDIEILGRHKVGVSYNAESNMKLGTLVAPVVDLRKAGVSVALGTDSTASNNNLDMLAEADFAAKLQSFKYGPGALKSEEIMAMLTSEGARAIGLGDSVGSLEVGKVADVIAVEVLAPHAVPLYNPYSHLVYSASGRDVRHTIVNGEVLMENRNLQTLDEQEILREAAAWARRIIA